MPLSAGKILNNRCCIVNLNDQGEFGGVYKVWDINLERPRALKENLDTSPAAQRWLSVKLRYSLIIHTKGSQR